MFADIVNVLLFHLERKISPKRLQSAGVHSQYKAVGKLHEQEREACVNSYDGASYRQQLSTRNRFS